MAAQGSTHPDTLKARMNFAGALLTAGHTIEAHLHLEALQPIVIAQFGVQDERTLAVHRALVHAFIMLSRGRDAVTAQRFIVNVLRERDGGLAPSTMNAENHLERRLFYDSPGKNHYEYKKDLLRRRIELFGKDHPNTVMLQLEVGADTPEEAISIRENAIRVMRKTYGDRSRSTAEAIASLARLYADQGKTREAIKLFAECGPNMLDDTWLNFEAATHQLWSGDLEGFHITRQNILGYWEHRIPVQNSSPEMFDRAMWLACIAETDDERQKLVLEKLLVHVDQVRKGLKIEAQERFPKSLQKQIRGCVLYRLGKDREALAMFHESIGTTNAGQILTPYTHYGRPTPWVHFFMAMAEHRLKNTEEAKRLFAKGESLLEGQEPSRVNTIIPANVGGEALAQWIMRSEAKALIFGR
jgi:tetratricopeptide (TPR) repeat protein